MVQSQSNLVYGIDQFKQLDHAQIRFRPYVLYLRAELYPILPHHIQRKSLFVIHFPPTFRNNDNSYSTTTSSYRHYSILVFYLTWRSRVLVYIRYLFNGLYIYDLDEQISRYIYVNAKHRST